MQLALNSCACVGEATQKLEEGLGMGTRTVRALTGDQPAAQGLISRHG